MLPILLKSVSISLNFTYIMNAWVFIPESQFQTYYKIPIISSKSNYCFKRMLSIRNQIVWRDPLQNLQKFHNTIIGINSYYQIIQVDTRNNIIEKTVSFIDESQAQPVINDVKFLKTDLANQYFFSFDKKIVSASGIIVDQSNSKADFIRGLDGKKDMFVFGKSHKNHNKYSVNAMRIGSQKKIVKLIDQKVNKLQLIYDQKQKAILCETTDQNVSLLCGEHWQHEQPMQRINGFLSDINFVYLINSSKELNTPKKRQMAEFSSFTQYKQNSRIRIEAFDRKNLTKGKGYSEFQLNTNRMPLKIDSFQFDIFIAFKDCLQIYDMRKLAKPFRKENESNIKDFHYQPNLQRIYLSCQRALFIYDYK